MDGSAIDGSRTPVRLSHPLCGSDLQTLFGALAHSGGLSAARLPQAGAAAAAALARWPFSAWERVRVARLMHQNGPMPAPIFIVGHWRSGTTHLYNLLGLGNFGTVSPYAAGMPWDLLGLVALLRPLLARTLPEHRYIDAIPVKPDSPQEDEVAIANMTRLSFYHGIYFPRHFDEAFYKGVFLDGASPREIEAWKDRLQHLLFKVWLDQDRRHVMVKNPVYTSRLTMLREIYPEAKFIHVHRNPYEVFFSMRNFFVKLFEQFAFQPFDHVAVDEVIFDTYDRMMSRYVLESAELPEGDLVELSYQDLIDDPIAQLERIYQVLSIEGFDLARPRFEAYLQSVRSYRRNDYVRSEEDLAAIEQRWGTHLVRWGYARPANFTQALPAAVGLS